MATLLLPLYQCEQIIKQNVVNALDLDVKMDATLRTYRREQLRLELLQSVKASCKDGYNSCPHLHCCPRWPPPRPPPAPCWPPCCCCCTTRGSLLPSSCRSYRSILQQWALASSSHHCRGEPRVDTLQHGMVTAFIY